MGRLMDDSYTTNIIPIRFEFMPPHIGLYPPVRHFLPFVLQISAVHLSHFHLRNLRRYSGILESGRLDKSLFAHSCSTDLHFHFLKTGVS